MVLSTKRLQSVSTRKHEAEIRRRDIMSVFHFFNPLAPLRGAPSPFDISVNEARALEMQTSTMQCPQK